MQLSIPAGITADRETVHVPSGDTHLTIALGARSRSTVVVEIGEEMVRHETEIVAEEGATCDIVCIQSTSGKRAAIYQRASIAEHASVHWHIVTLGEAVHDVRSEVRGTHGTSDVHWISYAKGQEQQRLSVHNVFLAHSGRGQIRQKGIAEGGADIAMKGMIEIGSGGGGTDTYLTQEVLMLDAASKVAAVPALEIKTNDVKASHSASIKRVQPDDLFYFAARGIPEAEARRMFILGFLGEMMERVEDGKAREKIITLIEEKYAC